MFVVRSEFGDEFFVEACEDEEAVADEGVVGEFVEGAFLEKLVDLGIGEGKFVEDAIFGFVFAFFGVGIFAGFGRVESGENFFSHSF